MATLTDEAKKDGVPMAVSKIMSHKFCGNIPQPSFILEVTNLKTIDGDQIHPNNLIVNHS